MLSTGLLRTRASLTSTAPDASPYQLDDLVIAYPVPAEAAELLDFTGRWAHERQPQRSTFRVGAHVREGRHGRTGGDAAYVLHAGTPGFGFASGLVWAVHPAWSGNHTTYAEHTSLGEHVLGAGELLLPGEVVLEGGASYRTPWVYGAFGTGLDEVASRFHRHVRDRGRPVSVDRPVTLNVWEAVFFDHDLDRLLALADRAAAIGVERFVLDDGWFGGRDTTGPASATGSSRARSTQTGCIPWSTGSRRSACSSGCGSSRRWSTSTPMSRARIRNG